MTEHILSLAALFVLTLAHLDHPGPVQLPDHAHRDAAWPRARAGHRARRDAGLPDLVRGRRAVGLGRAAGRLRPGSTRSCGSGGGLYLIVVRRRAVAREARSPRRPNRRRARPRPPSGRGLAICLTNPKSVLFFAGVFSAYVGPETPASVHWAAVGWSPPPVWSGRRAWRWPSRPCAPPRPMRGRKSRWTGARPA